ncbi:hypothetical protein JX266_011567 [Neoarthrinium moseri]|nr:hypothetical protein JX266_011567 [Neoarthrinium moseri]
MRAPFICRPCLARLRQATSHPTLFLRAASHAQALQTQNPPSEWPRPPGSVNSSQQSQARPPRDPDTERLDTAATIRIRRYLEDRHHVGESLGGGPLTRLKTMILNTKGDIELLWPAIAQAYGLPKRAAQEAAAQLKRLFWRRRRWEAAELLDEFEVWKVGYSKFLRQFSATGTRPTQRGQAAGRAVVPDAEAPSVSALKASWMHLDKDERQRHWSRILLSMLESNPELLPSFVRATYDPSWSPNYVVEDLLRILVLHEETLAAAGQDSMIDLIFFLRDATPAGKLRLGQDVIGTLVSTVPVARAFDMFNTLKAKGIAINDHTQLHFASAFAKSKEHKAEAARILCSLTSRRGFDINSVAASSVCTSLLHLADGEEPPQGQAAPDELFRMLLEHGLRPNLLNVTALMRNFCVRGYIDTAWTVYDLLLEYDIEPDERVYSTLLHAAKLQGDHGSVHRVLSAVHTRNTWNAAIANNFLHIIFEENEKQPERRRRQRKANNAFRIMLQVYAKFFRMEPLQKLCYFPLDEYLGWPGPIPAHATHTTDLAMALPANEPSQLMDPDTITLTTMISAAVCGAPRFYNGPSGSKRLMRYFQYFNDLFLARDPLAVAIVENHGTLVYDIFLRGILQFQGNLQLAVRVVRNMIQLAAEEEQKYGKSSHPYPSAYTWTILVNGFSNHGQPATAASMVKMMMRDGGVKPNMATWNALITAFARKGKARGAVQAMQYMEQAGFRPDKYTIQALSSMSLPARRRAVALLEAAKGDGLAQDDVKTLLSAPSPTGDSEAESSDLARIQQEYSPA